MKITESALKHLGFKYTDLGDDSPYEWWEKDDIIIWNFNDRYWLINALDQAGIDVEFTTIAHLSDFFVSCGREPLTLHSTLNRKARNFWGKLKQCIRFPVK